MNTCILGSVRWTVWCKEFKQSWTLIFRTTKSHNIFKFITFGHDTLKYCYQLCSWRVRQLHISWLHTDFQRYMSSIIVCSFSTLVIILCTQICLCINFNRHVSLMNTWPVGVILWISCYCLFVLLQVDMLNSASTYAGRCPCLRVDAILFPTTAIFDVHTLLVWLLVCATLTSVVADQWRIWSKSFIIESTFITSLSSLHLAMIR